MRIFKIAGEYLSAVQNFIQSSSRSQWLSFEGLSVYLRKANRVVPSQGQIMMSTLDIASVEANPPGQGIFTKFLDDIESLSCNIYVENILNSRFANFFERRDGWIVDYGRDTIAFRRGQESEWKLN